MALEARTLSNTMARLLGECKVGCFLSFFAGIYGSRIVDIAGFDGSCLTIHALFD